MRRSALLHLSLWMIQGPDCLARIKQFYPKCARNLTSFIFFLHVAFDKMPPRKEQPASIPPEAFELFVQFYDRLDEETRYGFSRSAAASLAAPPPPRLLTAAEASLATASLAPVSPRLHRDSSRLLSQHHSFSRRGPRLPSQRCGFTRHG